MRAKPLKHRILASARGKGKRFEAQKLGRAKEPDVYCEMQEIARQVYPVTISCVS
jgi:hypothetical protein